VEAGSVLEFGTVDADGHVNEPPSLWPEYLPAEFHEYAPRLFRDDEGRPRQMIAGELMPAIPALEEWLSPDRPTGGADPVARLADLDAEGIEIAVLFPTTGLFFAGIADDRVQNALCRAYNDWLFDYCATDRRRLVGIAVVPQNDVDAAVAEARRAVEELGFRGVMVRPNPIRGRLMHDPAYESLWAAIADLGVPVAVHEGTTQNVVQAGRDRFEDFAYRHACSHPHEQQMACLSFTCGGILERHPTLQVVFLESGCGWIAWWLERLDEHMEEWGHATTVPPLDPSEYFARQCFISTEPNEHTLPAIVGLMGAGNILFASDYPHPDAIYPGAVAALADRTDIDAATKQAILATNPRRCFGLP
jgi:predicted TIM-barrel fold metal-dependent hydrolase